MYIYKYRPTQKKKHAQKEGATTSNRRNARASTSSQRTSRSRTHKPSAKCRRPSMYLAQPSRNSDAISVGIYTHTHTRRTHAHIYMHICIYTQIPANAFRKSINCSRHRVASLYIISNPPQERTKKRPTRGRACVWLANAKHNVLRRRPRNDDVENIVYILYHASSWRYIPIMRAQHVRYI